MPSLNDNHQAFSDIHSLQKIQILDILMCGLIMFFTDTDNIKYSKGDWDMLLMEVKEICLEKYNRKRENTILFFVEWSLVKYPQCKLVQVDIWWIVFKEEKNSSWMIIILIF